ncbi:receptor-type tyrosine-protein phosphatase O isoform X2 [Stigmatopora nigra]
MLPSRLVLAAQLLASVQVSLAFRAHLSDSGQIQATLEDSDLRQNVSGYAARISGEARPSVIPLGGPGRPSLFNASVHGLCYSVGLLLRRGTSWSGPVQTVLVLTKPLPVSSVQISDYGESPESAAAVFQIQTPVGNVFSRVNISYSEGSERHSILYKDFHRGKTVFKHWLPGMCYRNITFQLVSEAGVSQTALRAHSDVTHVPLRHRTAPNPPLDISWKVVNLSPGPTRESRRLLRSVPPAEEEETAASAEEPPLGSGPAPRRPVDGEDEFVNGEAPDFVNGDFGGSGDAGSALQVEESLHLAAKMLPVLLEVRWLPPRAPTSYDGFNVYISRDGNATQTASVDQSTDEFFAELTEAGTYGVRVATLSAAGECEAKESAATLDSAFSFYLGPDGRPLSEPRQRPRAVSVRLLDSSTAAVSWAPSAEKHDGSVVSVVSTTCLKPGPGQRMESNYCAEENSTGNVIDNLTPGAQYRMVVYHTNGPLVSPPSEAVVVDIEPTGVRELSVYPLGPTAVILSWRRPFHVTFRKYVLQTFFFNPVTLSSEWNTYYEIAATASVIASVRVTDLLPAWYYNFRVTMVTWGEPPLSCCDGATVSFVTAPEAPHISSADYSHGVLFVRWSYGEVFVDLSHSRITHWQVAAVGRKSPERSYSLDVSRNAMRAGLPLPPGDIYNVTVTACAERGRNASLPSVVRLEPAPPRSLYAVNATHSSVTLLWSEDGVVDHYQVICRASAGGDQRVQVPDPQLSSSHVLTVSGLTPASRYECSVVSFSYGAASEPARVAVATAAKEMNPGVAAISALALLSVSLLVLLVFFLLLLRKKHLQMSRECGAETFVNFASFERDGKLPYNWGKTALKKRKLTSPVQLDDMEAYFKEMSKDSAYKFSLQFEELKSVGTELSHDAADLPVNRPKNRYTNILPYDFSRVRLMSLRDEEGADYINANYIPGYKHPKEYIATQGPLPETRDDFWKMVLQQKSSIVVMLTQCSERRRVKCDHYWPFNDEPVTYGEIGVEMLSEKEAPEWTVRKFRLGYADESRDVVHFNYTSWPDHGVPTVDAIESVLQFVRMVRRQAERGSKEPVVVHCSAGVGRTGTFVALDRLMQHIREQDFADVLGLVSEMRSHRLSMVQTEEQYVFIHQCVLLMWHKKKKKKRRRSPASDDDDDDDDRHVDDDHAAKT